MSYFKFIYNNLSRSSRPSSAKFFSLTPPPLPSPPLFLLPVSHTSISSCNPASSSLKHAVLSRYRSRPHSPNTLAAVTLLEFFFAYPETAQSEDGPCASVSFPHPARHTNSVPCNSKLLVKSPGLPTRRRYSHLLSW